MPYWIVSSDECDYDEYSDVAVIAPTAEAAEDAASRYFTSHQWKRHTVIELQDTGQTEVVLMSFHAG